METVNPNTPNKSNRNQHYSGRVIGGIVILMVGCAILARQAGLDLPYWLFSWPMILIVVALYIGGRNNFRLGGWIAPLLVGLVFLSDDVLDELDLEIGKYFWPTLIIALGLYMIFKPRRKEWSLDTTIPSDDMIDATAVFGGTKGNIISKNFKGGEVSTFFGGTDLNLSQADFQGTIVLRSTTAFGGVNIVAPPHWNIKSEVACIFGGLDDTRPQPSQGYDQNRTLVLKGICLFGGIEIKSF